MNVRRAGCTRVAASCYAFPGKRAHMMALAIRALRFSRFVKLDDMGRGGSRFLKLCV